MGSLGLPITMDEEEIKLREREQEILKARENISPEILKEYRDIFSFFDRDGGGTITTVELGQVMRTFGWTPTEMELQDMIGVIDQDENGCISFDEFVWLMSQDIHDEDIEDEIRDAFRVFDREGHGFISVIDLTDLLSKIGEKLSMDEVEELISEADIDGDGNIYYDEFIAMIFKTSSAQKERHLNMTKKSMIDAFK